MRPTSVAEQANHRSPNPRHISSAPSSCTAVAGDDTTGPSSHTGDAASSLAGCVDPLPWRLPVPTARAFAQPFHSGGEAAAAPYHGRMCGRTGVPRRTPGPTAVLNAENPSPLPLLTFALTSCSPKLLSTRCVLFITNLGDLLDIFRFYFIDLLALV